MDPKKVVKDPAPMLRGDQYRRTHKASVVGILGKQAPDVFSKGSMFYNKDRWTARAVTLHMCKWAKENPDCTPTLDDVKQWVMDANAERVPNREIVIASTPDKLPLRVALALTGGAYHEAFHTLYSCRRPLVAKEVADIVLPRWAKLADWSKFHGALQQWSNIVEDIRIERRGREKFDGVHVKLCDLQDFILAMEAKGKENIRSHGGKPGAFSVIEGVFRDVGLGYNTERQGVTMTQYRQDNAQAVKMVLEGPLSPLLKEAIDLGADDSLGCVRIAMDVIAILGTLAGRDQEDQQQQSGGETKCPNCGAPAKKLKVRPLSNGRGGKVKGKGTVTCTACGWQQEVDIEEKPPQPQDGDGDGDSGDGPDFEGFDQDDKDDKDDKGGKGQGDKNDDGDDADESDEGGDEDGDDQDGSGGGSGSEDDDDDSDQDGSGGAGGEDTDTDDDSDADGAGSDGSDEGDEDESPGDSGDDGDEDGDTDGDEDGDTDDEGTRGDEGDADDSDADQPDLGDHSAGGHHDAGDEHEGNDWSDIANDACDQIESGEDTGTKDANSALEEAFDSQTEREDRDVKGGEAAWRPYDQGKDKADYVKPSHQGKAHDTKQADNLIKSVREETAYLRARLRTIVRALEMTSTVHGVPKGKGLSSKFLVDTKATLMAREQPQKAYFRQGVKVDMTMWCGVVLDESGSMHGELENASRMLVALTEPFDALNCPTLAIGFRDGEGGWYDRRNVPSEEKNSGYHRTNGIRYDIFKAPHEKFKNVRWRFANTRADGSTPMSDGIQFALDIAAVAPQAHRFIFVVTDGQPNGEHVPVIKRQLRLAKSAGIHIVGVGLGHGASYVKELFVDYIWDTDLREIPKQLVAKLNELADIRGGRVAPSKVRG